MYRISICQPTMQKVNVNTWTSLGTSMEIVVFAEKEQVKKMIKSKMNIAVFSMTDPNMWCDYCDGNRMNCNEDRTPIFPELE